MKNIKSVAVIFLLTTLISCDLSVYKSSKFKNSKATVKTLAFLPFDFVIDGNMSLPKGITLEEAEGKISYDIQSEAYTKFLRGQKDNTVAFQDVNQTNAILAKANIQYNRIATIDKGKLCKLLGVDAIISGKFTTKGTFSFFDIESTVNYILGRDDYIDMTTTWTIHDARGDLLWKYHDFLDLKGTTVKALASVFIERASEKFPYNTRSLFRRVLDNNY
jgi:hypothetical protein